MPFPSFALYQLARDSSGDPESGKAPLLVGNGVRRPRCTNWSNKSGGQSEVLLKKASWGSAPP